jgi:ubiquitin-like 1-activating enzyme E1 B
MDTFI